MKFFKGETRYIKPVLIIAILAVLLGTVTGCEEFGLAPATSPQEEKPEKAAPSPTVITTKDRAILAVYGHLLSQAESHDAKIYIAEFYATCDNWSVESEFFKDGSSTWYVIIDMTNSETWEWKPYWQQASWFVFKDGKTIPSYLLEANAIRIEADLQELSPKPEPKAD
ncbi:hypothetical protein ACFLWG_02520 [Chloroflexota bacterium]